MDIANSKSERKASLEWGILRGTLQDKQSSRLARLEAYAYR
jgi:hypothetical protein